MLAAYADYQFERAAVPGGDESDMVFVNLYHEPLRAPMAYRAAKGFFDRPSTECGFSVRPQMRRHTAATNWVRAGADLDVVQRLLGHVSVASTAVYLHARDEERAPRRGGGGGWGALPMSTVALRVVPRASPWRARGFKPPGWGG